MNLEENIKRMEVELAAMRIKLQEEKEKEFKWKHNLTFYSVDAHNNKVITHENASTNMFRNGVLRKSKSYASKSLERGRLANVLEALVEQFQDEFGGDYTIREDYKYGYVPAFNEQYGIGAITMKIETAMKICELLNDGRVKL